MVTFVCFEKGKVGIFILWLNFKLSCIENLHGKGSYEFRGCCYICACVHRDPNTMESRSIAEADSCPHCLSNYYK